MVKIRKAASLENGLADIIKILSEDEIEAAIGKSVSFLRKCSDPDQPQQIDHKDSFKLDAACIAKNKAPPMLSAHRFMISQIFDNKKHQENDVDDMLVKFTILHGRLNEVINNAHDEQGDDGKEISELEKKEIFEALKKLEDKILKIKLTIDK
jgi:hypothetical protein